MDCQDGALFRSAKPRAFALGVPIVDLRDWHHDKDQPSSVGTSARRQGIGQSTQPSKPAQPAPSQSGPALTTTDFACPACDQLGRGCAEQFWARGVDPATGLLLPAHPDQLGPLFTAARTKDKQESLAHYAVEHDDISYQPSWSEPTEGDRAASGQRPDNKASPRHLPSADPRAHTRSQKKQGNASYSPRDHGRAPPRAKEPPQSSAQPPRAPLPQASKEHKPRSQASAARPSSFSERQPDAARRPDQEKSTDEILPPPPPLAQAPPHPQAAARAPRFLVAKRTQEPKHHKATPRSHRDLQLGTRERPLLTSYTTLRLPPNQFEGVYVGCNVTLVPCGNCKEGCVFTFHGRRASKTGATLTASYLYLPSDPTSMAYVEMRADAASLRALHRHRTLHHRDRGVYAPDYFGFGYDGPSLYEAKVEAEERLERMPPPALGKSRVRQPCTGRERSKQECLYILLEELCLTGPRTDSDVYMWLWDQDAWQPSSINQDTLSSVRFDHQGFHFLKCFSPNEQRSIQREFYSIQTAWRAAETRYEHFVSELKQGRTWEEPGECWERDNLRMIVKFLYSAEGAIHHQPSLTLPDYKSEPNASPAVKHEVKAELP